MGQRDDRIRVLLAEDHTLMRQMTRQFLEQSGIEVVGEARDGIEAVALTMEYRPDVVLMDVAMPNLNGIEATRQLKARCSSAAVLILTAYDDDPYVIALVEAGVAGYLLKTVTSEELVEAIRQVHTGESVLHPRIARKVLQYLGKGHHTPPVTPATGGLSEREKEVLLLAARGMANKEIAYRLHLSHRTVQAHLGRIFDRLGVASRTEAVIQAVRQEWIRLEDVGEE